MNQTRKEYEMISDRFRTAAPSDPDEIEPIHLNLNHFFEMIDSFKDRNDLIWESVGPDALDPGKWDAYANDIWNLIKRGKVSDLGMLFLTNSIYYMSGIVHSEFIKKNGSVEPEDQEIFAEMIMDEIAPPQ